MSVLKKAAISAAAVAASAFLSVGAIAVTVGTLNGIYTANDGSTLLVEEVPVNDGQRLTLIIHDVELSVWRKRPSDVFRYQHNGCDLTIVATGKGRTQAFSIDGTGRCTGRDAPFDSLSIRYDRSPQNAAGSVPDRAQRTLEKTPRLSRNEIFELQFRLDQLGFEVGEPTGAPTALTQRQAASFANKMGVMPGVNGFVLQRAREAAIDIEGWKRRDGKVELLLFTDEGTPLTMTVENWGLIFKSNAHKFVRGHDRDGSALYAQRFDVSRMERRLNIKAVPWATFGFQIHYPTPPKGERVEIEETAIRPEILEDGSVKRKTQVFKVPFLERPTFDPWYWYSNLKEETDPRLDGEWVMTLGQKGHVLLSRTFLVQRP